jgi:hypothetical protein
MDNSDFGNLGGSGSSSNTSSHSDKISEASTTSTSSKREYTHHRGRFPWPDQLHAKFITAIFDIGLVVSNGFAMEDIVNKVLDDSSLHCDEESTRQYMREMNEFRQLSRIRDEHWIQLIPQRLLNDTTSELGKRFIIETHKRAIEMKQFSSTSPHLVVIQDSYRPAPYLPLYSSLPNDQFSRGTLQITSRGDIPTISRFMIHASSDTTSPQIQSPLMNSLIDKPTTLQLQNDSLVDLIVVSSTSPIPTIVTKDLEDSLEMNIDIPTTSSPYLESQLDDIPTLNESLDNDFSYMSEYGISTEDFSWEQDSDLDAIKAFLDSCGVVDSTLDENEVPMDCADP